MGKQNNGLNFIYQAAYQLMLVVMPFITVPYVTRILNVDGLGRFSYVASVASYFILIMKLGLDSFGQREVARIRSNKQKLNEFFSNLLWFHLILGLLVIVCFFMYAYFLADPENKVLFYIRILSLVGVLIDINWLYYGLEQFKVTVTWSTVVKFTTVAAVFIFVKEEKDINTYAFIMCISTCLSEVPLWIGLRRRVEIVKPVFKEMLRYLKPMLILFIPTIAVSFYKQMDKVMLGAFSMYTDVAVYEYAERIINAPIGIISALGIVMQPKMSNLYAEGDTNKAESTIELSMSFIMWMSFAFTFGIISVSKEFVLLLLGDQFRGTTAVLMLLSVTMPFISWANVLRTQFILPRQKDKEFVISILSGAAVNLVLNKLCIPRWGAIGAAIGTIGAEVTVCLIQTIQTYHDLRIGKMLKNAMFFLLIGLVMGISIKLTPVVIQNPVAQLAFMILEGAVIYCVLSTKNVKQMIRLFKE